MGELRLRKLSVERTQWAVGNGFFHSGFVATPAGSLHYVYDCGALQAKANQNALKREIGEYVSRADRAHLVFLSHFDFDHVSGLPSLAKEVRIDKFVIPMIPGRDRVLSLARQLSDGSFSPDDSGLTQFYLALVTDPAGALTGIASARNEGVEVQVVSSSDVPSDENAPIVGDWTVEPLDLIAPADLPGASVGPLLTRESGAVTIVSCNGEDVWEWRHEIAVEAGNVIEWFVKALAESGCIAGISDLEDHSVIEELVLRKRNDLVRAYSAAVAKIGRSFTRNMTSLMLYSGPPSTSRFRAYRSRSSILERAEIGAWNPRPGWLGLGDADLRAARRVAHVNSVFRSQKPLVGTFAPSHHGSKRDWDMTLMDGFSAVGDFTPTTVFGASGAYGHPHGKVLREINELGGATVIVGTAQESRWTEALTVFVKP